MLSKELLQLTVLLSERLFIAGGTAEVLLQAKDFLLESLDV